MKNSGDFSSSLRKKFFKTDQNVTQVTGAFVLFQEELGEDGSGKTFFNYLQGYIFCQNRKSIAILTFHLFFFPFPLLYFLNRFYSILLDSYVFCYVILPAGGWP